MIDLMDKQRASLQRRLKGRGVFCHLRLRLMARSRQVSFPALDRCEIELGRKEIDDCPCLVPDGADEYRVPKRSAVFSIIEDIDSNIVAGRDALSDPRYRCFVSLWTLQETAIAPDYLVISVARQPSESLVAEDDRIVGLVRIGDDHWHAGCLERGRKWILAYMSGDETVAGVAGIGPILILFLHGGPARLSGDKCCDK
ncbi:hypothetical protein FHT29_005300 [Rhizobium sp. SG741]|nr:hypothetical protein [Rhizobium sp. SG741]